MAIVLQSARLGLLPLSFSLSEVIAQTGPSKRRRGRKDQSCRLCHKGE